MIDKYSQLSVEERFKRLSLLLLENFSFLGNCVMLCGKVIYDYKIGETEEERKENRILGTNGSNIFGNREFLQSLSEENFNFVILHEIYHIILDHPSLINDRTGLLVNIAMDLVVNNMIEKDFSQFKRHNIVLKTPTFGYKIHYSDDLLGWNAISLSNEFISQASAQNFFSEDIFDLPKEITLKVGRSIFTVPMNYSFRLSYTQDPNSKNKWTMDVSSSSIESKQIRQELMEQSKSSGSQVGNSGLPKQLDDILNKLNKVEVPWTTYLKRFLYGLKNDDDYCFSNPDKRFSYSNVLVPGNSEVLGEEISKVIILIDVSGSIDEEQLISFLKYTKSILNSLELSNSRVITFATQIYNDCKLSTLKDYKKFIGELEVDGGTNFVEALDYIKSKYREYSCLICFTDGYWYSPPERVKNSIFFLPGNSDDDIFNEVASFGKTYRINTLVK